MVWKTTFTIIILAMMGYSGTPEPNRMVKSDPKIGKRIYTTGIGSSEQKIVATVSGMDMEGSMMACVNCHGECGKGKNMQGVTIPDLKSAAFISRYYDQDNVTEKKLQKLLKKAITMGINPNGDQLHAMMPRYNMSITDMEHLLAYLSILGDEDNCAENE